MEMPTQFSKNAKILAPTLDIMVSKAKSTAGVIMIMRQSLDLDLMTVVLLEIKEKHAFTSMTTFAKEVYLQQIQFYTSMLILL